MMGEGMGSTVTGYVAAQPPVVVYDIVATPELAPVTTPTASTPAAAPEELHVPPGSVSVKVMVAPTHTRVGPVMAAGSALTVIGLVR